MPEQKLVIAHCKKTGKRFCLELRNGTGEFKVVNFMDISDADAEKIPADTLTAAPLVADNLLACHQCGTRRVASCTCARSFRCKRDDPFRLGCLYCKELELEKRKAKGDLKLYVSSPHYDNIGQVLTSMGLSYQPFAGKYDCDVLFINCGTSDAIASNELADFVARGGCVYISDLASKFVVSAFPGMLNFNNDTEKCKLKATIEDPELKQVAGDSIEIEFDLDVWSLITDFGGALNAGGRVLLRAARLSKYPRVPLMVSFPHGKGTVFYTSFHNHAQASEKEKMLLQLLLLKQLSTNYGTSLEQTGELVGLNIAVMKDKFKK